MPALGARVVFLPAVGIDRHRQAGVLAQPVDQRLHIGGRGTVHAEHLQARIAGGKGPGTGLDGIPLVDMPFVPAGEADPIGRAQFLCDLRLDLGFPQGGLGLDQKQVRPRRPEQLHPPPVEVPQYLVRHPVMPPVFRPVRQIGPIGSHRPQAEGIGPAGGLAFRFPPGLPGPEEQGHGPADQGFPLGKGIALGHKPRDGGLVATGDAAIRPRPEKIPMHLLHQPWAFRQGLCRPQAVVQVAAQGLQGGGHGAVYHHNSHRLQRFLQARSHGSLLIFLDSSGKK